MTSTENRETTHIDDVAQLARRVEVARGMLPLQADPALYQALSESEIEAERDLAAWIREQRRKQQRAALAHEVQQQRRSRKNTNKIQAEQASDERWHRRALAARRRVANPDARLAQLYQRAEWSSRALIGVVILGMLWAGVNVQHNLVPSGDMSDPLYWLSYGFEAMISIPIITIMVVATTAARWGREIARGKVVFLEAALLGVTIALNAGPHVAAGAPARAAEAAVAPVMVGVVIWLHAWVSARYAQLIDAIPTADDYRLDYTEITSAGLAAHALAVPSPVAVAPTIAAESPASTSEDDSENPPAAAVDDEATTAEPDVAEDEQQNVPGVVPFARREVPEAEETTAQRSSRPRGRRWFGGDMTAEEIERLAQEVYDSGRTQQSVDALVHIIRDAVAGHAATAIARELGMSAHSTVLRALNVADELYRAENRVA
ncbi:hypothetical protein [Nocardia wallacei]|uniref:hypothetical protein n=1 Tax=Nocardia wallacei TaxID=480035 RepID=UPI002456CF3B|nr:hypothetical protein [Nocardia wallacei]